MTRYFASYGTGWRRDAERPSMWLEWAQVRKTQNTFPPILQSICAKAVYKTWTNCSVRLLYCVLSSCLFSLLCLSAVDGGDWGLDERDMEASAATVRSMCEQVDADLITLRERNEAAGLVRDYLIRRRVGELDFLEVR